MFGGFYRRALLCCTNLNTTTTRTPSFLLLQPFSSSATNNVGFSPETASNLSDQIPLHDSEKPHSVIELFRTHGISNPQLSRIIRTCPEILSFDYNKTILPIFNFLLSKGASSSEIVQILIKDPKVFRHSLEDTIAPSYDFVKRYLLSDESTIHAVKTGTCLIYSQNPAINIQTLLENGVPESKVPILLRRWGHLLKRHDPPSFKKVVEEVKELGFKPHSKFFIVALNAKIMKKTLWKRKTSLYKKWGWSEEMIGSAFLRYPWCMLVSEDQIEAKMEFLVKQMGWNSLVLAKHPELLWMSLEKIIIPRAFVLQFLQSRGLIKDAKSATPYKVAEKVFLEKFVNCFKEESTQLMGLYEEKKVLSKKT